MSDPHLPFVVAAYAVTFVVVAAMVGTTVLRHRALRRALTRFEKDRDR